VHHAEPVRGGHQSRARRRSASPGRPRRPHEVGHDRDRHHRRAGRGARGGHRLRPAAGGPRGTGTVGRRADHRRGRPGRAGVGAMKRTSIQLADGRELIYFDERDDAVRDEIDRRDLPPQPTAGELRYDPLVDEWVAIAAHRQTRTFLPATSDCPLCPSTVDRSTEVPAYDYDVVVFENRFPSFNHRLPAEPLMAPTPLSPLRPAAGRCEVVCFTPDHNASFAALPHDRVRTVMAALADRTAELSALPEIEHVFPFENR